MLGHNTNELFNHCASDHIRVTILRAPVERIVSHCAYAKTTKERYLYSEINKSGMDLNEYMGLGVNLEIKNWCVQNFSQMTYGG